MVAGVLVFILGALFGGGVFVVMFRMFTSQIERLRKRNDKLLERINIKQVELTRMTAYRQGYSAGAKSKESRAGENEKNG